MKFLVLGVVLGLAGGFVAGFTLQEETEKGGRGGRHDGDALDSRVERGAGAATDEADALRKRINELEALLARKNVPAESEVLLGITVPQTKEGIDLLWKEFEDTGDLDRLLALMEALLLQGKSGYPRLTQLVMKTAMLAPIWAGGRSWMRRR